jgi:hypothetical protein
MRTNTAFRRQAQLFAATAFVVNALAVAAPAEAGLTIDMRVTSLNGTPIAATKSVVVIPGNTVTMSIFAIVSGTNSANDDMVKTQSGNIVSSAGGLLGNLIAAPTNTGGGQYNFRGNGFQNGAIHDLDSDGDLDVGTPMTAQNVTQFFVARSVGEFAPPTPVTSGSAEVLIGLATFTVAANPGGTSTLVNFVNRVQNNGSPETEAAVWWQDGGFDGDGNVQAVNPFNPAVAGAFYGAGAPVQIGLVPEPAGLALVGVAALGLLARRPR